LTIRWGSARVHSIGYYTHLSRYFRTYRQSGDMANAVALWNEISRHRLEVLLAERGNALCFRQRSIVSAFMPKSGGTFLFNRLLQDCNYAEYWWGISHPSDQTAVFAVPDALARYLQGGFASHTHARPSPYNCRVFNEARVDRIWVHVRDPIDATIAAYHHYLGEGQGEGTVAEQRRIENLAEGVRLGVDPNEAGPEACEAFVREHVSFMIGWLREWLEIERLNPGFVHFTHFEELDDAKGLLSRVFRAFDVEIEPFEISPRLASDRRRTDHPDSEGEISAALRRELGREVEAQLAPLGWLDRLAEVREARSAKAACTDPSPSSPE